MKTKEQIAQEKIGEINSKMNLQDFLNNPEMLGCMVKNGIEQQARIRKRSEEDPAAALLVEFFSYRLEQSLLSMQRAPNPFSPPSAVIHGEMMWLLLMWEDINKEFDEQLKVVPPIEGEQTNG